MNGCPLTAYVAYLRQSTRKQQLSGLGIEAQEAAVAAFLKPDDVLLGSFVETESGRCDKRPQLAVALAECRRRKVVLLVARWDRLGRNVRFLAELLESDVEIRCCDNPHATKFTLHILAACAQQEAELCSTRTKAALAAAKARGVALGGHRANALPHEARAKGRAVQASAARSRALEILPHIEAARAAGACTSNSIAHALNAQGITTYAGGRWQAAQVQRVLSRIAA